MLKRQNAKDHINTVNNICRRICADAGVLPVLKRLKQMRVSAKYIDISLGLSSGTASEWMGNRREVPGRYIHELIRLELRVHHDIHSYLEAPEGARLFKVPQIAEIKSVLELVRAKRHGDPAWRSLPDEGTPELGLDGKPIFGTPGL